MKDFLKYIPGFRSDTKWKKVSASAFYILHILMSIIIGLDYFLIVGGLVLFLFTLSKLLFSIKNKKSYVPSIILFIATVIIFSSGISISDKKDAKIKEAEQIKLAQEQKISDEKEAKLKEEKRIKFEEAKKEEERLQEEAKKEEERLQEEAKKEEERLQEERKQAELEKQKQEQARIEKEKEKEEARKAEEQKIAREKEEAEKLEKEKKAQAAKSQQTAKRNNNSNASASKPTSTNSAPAKQGVDNTAQILRTKSGKMYHSRKCGNGNFYATTLQNAKASGLTPCSKCY